MIKINVNKKKTVEFDVNVTGIQCDNLAGRLSLFYEGVIYSFPASVESGNVIKVVIPPLREIINNIPDKAQGDLRLEVIGNETFMMPWTGSAILEHPVKVEATMRGSKLMKEEETPKIDVEQIREKEEVVDEKKKEKKDPKTWAGALLKAAKEPVKRKKSKIGEALSGEKEDKEDKEKRKLKNKKLGEELAEAILTK